MSEAAVTALKFEVGGQAYGLPIADIIDVVPTVPLRTIPGVPAAVAGVFLYRAVNVPVLDVTRMLTGLPSEASYSTRIVLVNYTKSTGASHPLGLRLERASQGLTGELRDLAPSGVTCSETPYLGKLATHGTSTIQLINIQQLIPERVSELLFIEQ